MTQHIKTGEEIQAEYMAKMIKSDCEIPGCIIPGKTLSGFCPYHKAEFDFRVERLRNDFIALHTKS